jgi:hypothetical protein
MGQEVAHAALSRAAMSHLLPKGPGDATGLSRRDADGTEPCQPKGAETRSRSTLARPACPAPGAADVVAGVTRGKDESVAMLLPSVLSW